VLTLFMMDSPNNCVCNYQFGALTPIWERPSHHPSRLASGDIHDTRCLTDNFVQNRLISCDFKEEKHSGRMIQYLSEV
ncbi:hypothetical protein MHN32_13865, partial [Pseudoalteromonas sp. Of11M-6]|nr:hypothetical protein [Pseudoalteromonas sp. Of11M-6]